MHLIPQTNGQSLSQIIAGPNQTGHLCFSVRPPTATAPTLLILFDSALGHRPHLGPLRNGHWHDPWSW